MDSFGLENLTVNNEHWNSPFKEWYSVTDSKSVLTFCVESTKLSEFFGGKKACLSFMQPMSSFWNAENMQNIG
jgi:hypothetical protein